IDCELATDDELAEEPPPAGGVQLVANAVDRQLVMPVARDAGILTPQQDVGEIADTELLAGPVDGREGLLRGDGLVHHVRWRQAIVAVSAWLGQLLAEVAEQGLPAAGRQLAETDQGVELLPLHPLKDL